MIRDSDEEDADEEVEAEGDESPLDDVASGPSETADPQSIVNTKIPQDIREKYEVISYRNAAVILAETRPTEFGEVLEALRSFSITTEMIKRAGGNESEMPKEFSKILRPKGWHETIIRADLHVTLSWREEVRKTKGGKPVREKRTRTITREKYLDGHKIDYVKEKVAFDLEWNAKDQTFDRDLYAMNAFFLSGALDAGVLVTRSASLNDVFRTIGKETMKKYGASTTWMGKLLYRLNAGRNGGCPILAVGITPKAVSDWEPPEKH